MLCCESDLQVIDLLRRVFSKTIEPLLQMINSFIFTGEFTDPFNEFFVEKMFRRNTSTSIEYQEFIYKMTSEPTIKIPAFLIEVSPYIFKTGSSVHLLKKGNLHGIDITHL